MSIFKHFFQKPNFLLPGNDTALKKIIANTDSSDFLKLMINLGIPQDISDRISSLDITDPARYEDALLSCYGRLQYLQPAGLFVAAKVRSKSNLPAPRPLPDLSKLSVYGALEVKSIFSAKQLSDVLSFLKDKKVFNGHVPEASDGIGRNINSKYSYPYGSYQTSDLIFAPHILEQVMSQEILDCAESHLGCVPTLVALQAWWNFPGHEDNFVNSATDSSITNFAPKNFHRDLNDFRMFWVYVYLTDVGKECGPHEIIKFSGDFEKVKQRGEKKLNNFDPQSFFYQYGYQIPRNQIDLVFEKDIKTFVGPVGSTFFSNGFNFHRIRYPLLKPRLMMAARFAIGAKKHLGNQTIKASAIRERIINMDIKDYAVNQILGR